MLGERPEKSAPSLTLARNLRRYGFETVFSNGVENRNMREWVHLCRKASVLVLVRYEGLNTFIVRQLAIAVSLGLPVIRWWVGSDVITLLESARIAEGVSACSWLFSRQIAVSPHLVQELKTVGVPATYLPSVIELDKNVRVLNNVPRTVLVYLPQKKKEFYGVSLVKEAVKQYRDIEFVIVADDEHSLASYSNVRSVGWVSEMDDIWDSVGGLLRITRHDGMPRMVLEALRRGKHVIYSWPFPGCVHASTKDDVFSALSDFREVSSTNMTGIAQVQELLTPDPAARFSEMIVEVLKERKLFRLVGGIGLAITLTLKMKLSR